MIYYLFKLCRKINSLNKPLYFTHRNVIQDADLVSKLIANRIINNIPSMITRFGAFELEILANYLNVKNNNKNFFKFINGEIGSWKWENSLIKNFSLRAGFFPYNDLILIEKFSLYMLDSIPNIDILGSWLKKEILFDKDLQNIKKVNLELLNPFFAKTPWTHSLKNKNVLVIHPYKDSIEFQYKNRDLLFTNKLLPEFQLIVIRSPNNRGALTNNTNFDNWFTALEYIKSQIDLIDFDVCLIGCGAYGFILADHIKKRGKIAIHLGGSLQLLFGIIGNRWLDENYHKDYKYTNFFNKYLIRPFNSDITISHKNIFNDFYT